MDVLVGERLTIDGSCQSDLQRLLSVVAGRYAVGGPEDTAEVGGVGKAPACGYGLDRPGPQAGVGQVAAAAFQSALAYPVGDRWPCPFEKPMQVAGGDVVGGGDGVGGESGVTESLLDEVVDLHLKGGCARLRRKRA